MECPQSEHGLLSWEIVGFSSCSSGGQKRDGCVLFLTTFHISASVLIDVRASKDLQDNSVQSPYFIDEKTALQRLRLNDFSVHK